MIIAQLFNRPFSKVQRTLNKLNRLGITHILVSPPQLSHSSNSWWGRYQPVDFTRIDGPLGDAGSLHSLCHAAGRLGMRVIADTVLHHLSNESRFVRIRGNRILRAQYPRFSTNDFSGLHRLGKGRGLPVLDTRSGYVRQELRNYLRFLFEVGIRGFRFDSAKHMDPHLFDFLLEGLPPMFHFGELVYQDPQDYPPAYWASMKAYDFPLAWAVNRAFSYQGDLRSLLHPQALWGPLAVSFVNHHDLAWNRRGFAGFRLSALRDRMFAYGYVLARGHGTPLVYGPDLRYPEVKAGLRFYRAAAGERFEVVKAEPTAIAFKRGDRALCALNKAGWRDRVTARLEPGLYRDLVTGWEGATNLGRLTWEMPARNVTLLVRVC